VRNSRYTKFYGGALAVLVCAGVAALAPAAASAQAVPSVAKLVPAAMKAKGEITVASDASYPPDEYLAPDGKTVIGMDADLSKALGAAMGLKVNIVNVTFDGIIPGMAAGRYQIGASSFTDTKAREKTVDFVDYASVGEAFYTKTHGGVNIKGIGNICGLSVAVETGTTEERDAKAQSKTCTKAGKKAVNVLSFPSQNSANEAVASGRAQLGFADAPPVAYQIRKSGGQFKLVGKAFATAPYGIAVAKSSGLTKAVKAAMLHLIKNGTYGKIFKKWGISSFAIPASQVKINGATS
jgi:polar amino acid transport system substrate-binding protein